MTALYEERGEGVISEMEERRQEQNTYAVTSTADA